MQLELVSDAIGDHAPLDAMVYVVCESDCNKTLSAPGNLLLLVMASTPDKLDKKFLDFVVAKQILEEYSLDPGVDENSNLKKLFHWCWQHDSFKKIRHLSEHNLVLICYILQNHRNFVANDCALTSRLGEQSPVCIMFLYLPIDLYVTCV